MGLHQSRILVIDMILRWMVEDDQMSEEDTSEIHRLEGIPPIDYISNQRSNLISTRLIEAGFLDKDFDPPSLSLIDKHARVAWRS